jgi:simple sugar transport system permease protein
MRQVAAGTAAALGTVLLLALVATIFGHSPVVFLRTLFEGSVGSPFALRGTLLKSVPLLLTGLSVVMAFRAGAFNIGAEGQFIAGALAALLAADLGIVAALIAAALAGAAWASIASLLRIWRNAPEVLTTILLNFIAVYLLGWCVNGPLQEASRRYPQSDRAAASMPDLGPVHAGLAIAVGAAILCWWILYRTMEGLRLRATGFNPEAARNAGINVHAQLARAMAISGAMAGVAGAIELLGVTHRLFERFAAGYGYAGIAVALLAQLQPLASIAAALFFGALSTGAGELQRSANISAAISTFGQAAVILILVAVTRKRDA